MTELDTARKLYEKKFDDSFPMIPMIGTAPDEIVKIIHKCISENKDVYDMGYLSLDDDVIY